MKAPSTCPMSISGLILDKRMRKGIVYFLSVITERRMRKGIVYFLSVITEENKKRYCLFSQRNHREENKKRHCLFSQRNHREENEKRHCLFSQRNHREENEKRHCLFSQRNHREREAVDGDHRTCLHNHREYQPSVSGAGPSEHQSPPQHSPHRTHCRHTCSQSSGEHYNMTRSIANGEKEHTYIIRILYKLYRL